MCVPYKQNLQEILERSKDNKGGGVCVPYKLNLQEIHKRSEDNKGGGEGQVKEALCVYPTS